MNQVYFRLGRKHGVDRVAREDGRKLFRNIVHHTRKHALWLILLSRFVFGFRMAIPATVGALGMSMPRFLVADFIGSIIWAVTMGVTGYAAGHVGQLLIGNEWEVGFVLMALTLGWGVYRRRHVQQVTTLIDRTDALVGHPGPDEPLTVDDPRVLDDE
jgi:membrane protein DedA with SNARE-associated domain